MTTVLRRPIRRFHPRGLGPFASVASGFAMGQLALAASLPIVARIYTRSDVGAFAVLLAYSQVASIVLTGRLEQVLPRIPASRRWPAARTVLISGTLLAPGAAVGVLTLTSRDGWVDLASVSLLICTLCACNLAAFVVLATQDYRAVALLRLSNGVVTGGAQVVGGLILPEVWVLVVTYAIGNLAASLFAMPSLLRLRRESARESLASVWRAERLGRFIRNVGPAALMSNLGLALPLISVAIIFGGATAGSFYLARRLLMVPTQLIAASVSEVSYALVARETARRVADHVYAWLRKATGLAAALLCLGLASAPVVSFVVGPGYPQIAWVVVLLTVPAATQMVATSFSNILLALHLERTLTVWSLGRLGGLILVFLVADALVLSFLVTVAVFSTYTTVTYAVLLFLTLRGVKSRVAAS